MILERKKIEKKLYKELTRDTILTMIGARQVGKTTLLYKLKDYLENQNVIVSIFSLEDKDLLADLNKHPKNIFNYISDINKAEKRQYLLIDEIQYLDDPSNFLKYLYDLYHLRLKIVVTGSSAFYIDKKYKDSLAGRKKIINITPFTFSEFLVTKNEEKLANKLEKRSLKNINGLLEDNDDAPIKLLNPEKDKITSYYKEYFKYGGYPKIVIENETEEKIEMLKELTFSFLKKDILESGIKNEEKFYSLLKILASQCGELLNSNELSNTLNISREAVDNYLYVLEKGFIIKLIKPFHTNLRKELSKMPKVFFLDTGYRNSILNLFEDIETRIDKGQSLENSFFIEMNKIIKNDNSSKSIQFWRTKDKNEVDFIIDDKFAFEIKFNKNKFKTTKYKSFVKAYENIPLKCVSYSNDYKNEKPEDTLTIFDFLN